MTNKKSGQLRPLATDHGRSALEYIGQALSTQQTISMIRRLTCNDDYKATLEISQAKTR